MNYKFIPTDAAKRNPRRMMLGGNWVAIGGPIKVGERVWPEATQEQYSELYDKNFHGLVVRQQVREQANEINKTPEAPVDDLLGNAEEE
mgnify:CR=1 FL=1